MSSPGSFLDRLRESVLVGDGAMGSMIYARGVGLDACYDGLNLTDRALVLCVHEEYVAAGAQGVETNTFGANRTRLHRHGLSGKAAEVNEAGAPVARGAARGNALLA